MWKAEAIEGASPTSTVELASQEIEAMIAEAIAVDVLLQRIGRGRYDFTLVMSSYLSGPAEVVVPEPDADHTPS